MKIISSRFSNSSLKQLGLNLVVLGLLSLPVCFVASYLCFSGGDTGPDGGATTLACLVTLVVGVVWMLPSLFVGGLCLVCSRRQP